MPLHRQNRLSQQHEAGAQESLLIRSELCELPSYSRNSMGYQPPNNMTMQADRQPSTTISYPDSAKLPHCF